MTSCCRSCGDEADAWAIYSTPVGDVRVDMCSECLDHGRAPRLSWREAVELTMEGATR
jgi:hypothetical protein